MNSLENKFESNAHAINPFGIEVDAPMQKDAAPKKQELKPVGSIFDRLGFYKGVA